MKKQEPATHKTCNYTPVTYLKTVGDLNSKLTADEFCQLHSIKPELVSQFINSVETKAVMLIINLCCNGNVNDLYFLHKDVGVPYAYFYALGNLRVYFTYDNWQVYVFDLCAES